MKSSFNISAKILFKGIFAIVLVTSFLFMNVSFLVKQETGVKTKKSVPNQEIIKSSTQQEAVIPALNFDFGQIFVFNFRQVYFIVVKHCSIYLKAGDFIKNTYLECLFPVFISPQAP